MRIARVSPGRLKLLLFFVISFFSGKTQTKFKSNVKSFLKRRLKSKSHAYNSNCSQYYVILTEETFLIF